MCISVIDVTHPEQPAVITQIKVEAEFIRCNSLGLVGNTLVVAHQTEKAGQAGAGLDVYDIANPNAPQKLFRLRHSGPHSRGVHFVWSTDGRYAYLSTGARDFTPHNPSDDQFLMIVDVSDPRHPHETGRWWLPGTRQGDTAPPPPARVAVRCGDPHAFPRCPRGQTGSRLCRLDRWRLDDPRHRRHGASKADRAPIVAVGRQWICAHRAADRVARHCHTDRGSNGGQMQGLAEAQLGVGHQRRAAPISARGLPACARPGCIVQGRRPLRCAQHRHEPADRHVSRTQ